MDIFIGVCRKSKKLMNMFDVLEIQEIFYNIPRESTVKKWAEKAKKYNTKLSFKVFQGLTHNAKSPTWRRYKGSLSNETKVFVGDLKLNDTTIKWVKEMINIAKILSSPVIVIQTPASFSLNAENKKRALEFFRFLEEEIRKTNINTIIGWEPRGKWLDDRSVLKDILSEINTMIHVVDPFFHNEVITKEVVYFRLHGKPYLNYKYAYTEEDFEHLYKLIKEKFNEGVTRIYVLFNNVMMINDALRFKEYLKKMLGDVQ